jgi:SNF2 family DNA or RNA helicase
VTAPATKVHGTIELRGKHWFIRCAPHVVLRLKRVFPRIDTRQHDLVKLVDTVEVCRELEWFMLRYPLEFTSMFDRDTLRARANDHRERETLVAQLLAGHAPPPKFELAVEPREYQRVGAAMALAHGAMLLADDVGLGKTATSICTLTDPVRLPALVVTLTHLTKQWESEFRKFAPQLRTHILKSGQPYDICAASDKKRSKEGQQVLRAGGRPLRNELPDVIISNYHKLAGWAETLAPVVRSVIFDEAQELRTGKSSQKGAAAYHIANSCTFRLGLTATPIYNYGAEIYNVMQGIAPDALGDHAEFTREWCGYGEGIKDPKAFGTYLRDQGLMLRRTRAEVGRELPPITLVPQEVDADEAELDRVESAAAELARIILGAGERVRGEKFRASEELSWLVRQATGIAKAPYVGEFVKLLIESGEQVVLYGWHRAVYDLWLERLKEFSPVLFTGSESTNQKEDAKRRFVAGESKVLIISLRAGAGLDGLQYCCRTVVFGELDWSPGVHEQCLGRVARDGQKEPVVAYYLIANSGSDPVVSEVLGIKRAQIQGLRDPNVNAELLDKLDTGGGHVKRLAEVYLQRKRGAQPAEATA